MEDYSLRHVGVRDGARRRIEEVREEVDRVGYRKGVLWRLGLGNMGPVCGGRLTSQDADVAGADERSGVAGEGRPGFGYGLHGQRPKGSKEEGASFS
ncbi:hypothetical protein Tco_0964632 [Tanacetum coccineum]